MRYPTLRIVVAILTFVAGVTAARIWQALKESEVKIKSPSVAQRVYPVASVKIMPCVSRDSRIRQVNFELGMAIDYGDVTGDGQEEAVIMEGLESHGTAIPYRVHVYTLNDGKRKLLWRFDTGDRADGGLRRAYVDHGDLVVELYGKNSSIEDPYNEDSYGACCAQYYNRKRYKWNGRRFRPKGEREIFIHDSGGASPEIANLPQRCPHLPN